VVGVGAPVEQVAIRATRLAGTGGARVVQAFWGRKMIGLNLEIQKRAMHLK